MSRIARVIVREAAHHITQRANGRRYILATDEDRQVYLDLLRHYTAQYELDVTGYCLMSNHVHLVAVPKRSDSLAQAMKYTPGRYALYWNIRQTSSGHAWQSRPYSCPLDERHLWEALRYAELNPVRAGMVKEASEYRWSSAAAHCGKAAPDALLKMELWRRDGDEGRWRVLLGEEVTAEFLEAIRKNTHTGRPLGSEEFVKEMERLLLRRLRPDKGGRPGKKEKDERQPALAFREE